MKTTESTGRDGGRAPSRGRDPMTRQLLRLMAARRARWRAEPGTPGEPEGRAAPKTCEEVADQALDATAVMELLSAWHRRGVEVGFPELMVRPALGRRRPPYSHEDTSKSS